MKKDIDFEKRILVLGIVIFLGIISFSIYSSTFTEEENILAIYHWWTSPGEHAAMSALINVFTEKYPEAIVLPTSVISRSSAGGGVLMFNVVKPNVFAKEGPDAFLIHAGYEGKTYFDAELLEPVDDIWESENLERFIPKIVQAMCKFKGNYYSIPVGIHRTNVVWYNKKILDDNNIHPEELTTWELFFDACEELRNSGVEYPIQMGTTWTAQHVFDQIIASQGIEFYEDWINGKVTSADDPRLIESLNIFKKYLNYTNPDNQQIEWNVAVDRIIDGEGAFNIMGDWANGEFKSADFEYGSDYGTFIVPGTGNMYGLVIDAFQRPKYTKHPTNSERWLKVVASKEGQDAFNPIKGSISARADADVSKYDLYSRLALLNLLTVDYMFPAISNGAPREFEIKEQEMIKQFLKDFDSDKAAKMITDYSREINSKYTINWELN